MAIGAITMILSNVGLQIYNNWQGNRQNSKLQKKREEFEEAARQHQTERMMKLMHEGQELMMEIEKENHTNRLNELKNDVGNLLHKLTYESAIANWPLNVLPIVMKNQALGNLLANHEEKIALHCILTPSNSTEFNKYVFPSLERNIEDFCNENFSVMSSHPVLFYSGAYRSSTNPSEIQIESMKSALKNIPTLLITPFFRPQDGKLTISLNLWGVGLGDNELSQSVEFIPNEFQRDYNLDDDYIGCVGLIDEIIEDLTPYIQCLIGYMTDTYFWSYMGSAPKLPSLLINGTINIDGMKFLVNESKTYYDELFLQEEQNIKDNPFKKNNLLPLYEGTAVLWDEDIKINKLTKSFLLYVSNRVGRNIVSMDEALSPSLYSIYDLPFIKECSSKFLGTRYESKVKYLKQVLESLDFDYSILESTDIESLMLESKKGNPIASYRLGEIYEYSIGVDQDDQMAKSYYAKSTDQGFILAKIRVSSNRIAEYGIELNILENSNVSQAFALECDELFSNNSLERIVKHFGNINIYHPRFTHIVALSKIKSDLDICKSERTLQQLAEAGYIESIIELANLYKGNILDENPKKHFYYSQKGMLQNNPFCMYCLGMCYLEGYGTTVSSKNAISLLEKAAEMGEETALNMFNIINKFQ